VITLSQLSCMPRSLAFAMSQSDETKPEKRPVTVADAIQMGKFGDPDELWGSPLSTQLAHFSPDGKKVVVLIRKGNLTSNTREYSLLFWRTDQILRSVPPKVLLTMSSSSNRQGINNVTWLGDSERIAFSGEHPGETQQVYVLDIRTRSLKKVTSHPSNVISYTITSDGEAAVYLAEPPVKSIWNEKTRRAGVLVSTQLLSTLVAGQTGTADSQDLGSSQLFFQPHGGPERLIVLTGKIPTLRQILAISPDGKYVVVATAVAEVPERWKEYSDGELQRIIGQHLWNGEVSQIVRYQLIDLSSGKSRELLSSPVSADRPSEVVWSPDSRSIVITNTFLPLEGTDGEERKARQSSPFTIEEQIADGNFTKITNQDLLVRNWDSKTNELKFLDWKLAREDRVPGEVFFYKNGAKWEKVARSSSAEVLPRIMVEEDLNLPPKLFALAPNEKTNVLLFDPNPQFSELRFGRVEEIQWKGSDGHNVKGGLYYPVDYEPGKRYPLVIQTHGWVSHTFWIDGAFTTAFAAQALAGKNIMVLQADITYTDMDVPGEVTREVSAFEEAIDYLDKRGFIEPNKVGLIGFSRTCLYVKYALTHSKYNFAAASVTDGVDGGYFPYLANLNVGPNTAQGYEGLNGGVPFGDGLKSWIALSPAFRVDKVRTPLLITALYPASILTEWEWFAALYRLNKPVEMVIIQDGTHVLEKPWDRMVSQQGNVDWFCFWLKGEEDPDPAKAEQYTRWRELRKLQDKNKAAGDKSLAPMN
jgi:dipeptidyl aminopeptidase/acylaminoacyl peptidase